MIGIVIPVVGILVSVYLALAPSDDQDSAAGRPSTGGGGSADTSGASPTPRQAASKIMFGPKAVEVDVNGSYLELDTRAPLVEGEAPKGVDILVNTDASGAMENAKVYGYLGGTVAPIAATSGAVQEADCLQAVQRNASDSIDNLQRGRGICVETSEGRVAFLRVASAPPKGPVTFDMTVWELRG
ncbi:MULTISPECIES: hypothetical protein [Streptomyces]|uniref:hypothetical protein n=1 Tax=Streptomyces TaxID=1883 RepID=UPI00131A6668|nr:MULTISPECIES: hypothetical protein [Streptomyces]MBP5896591.1 hypothetical protein [Streptomyces sp. LBUM 1481]MDX2680304.1 hypothetical protein [Streptomyces sp. NY05-11A]MDX3112898.1 hypothetical protein [Streptomyces scabiei]MDX3244893.1 hypothetical protein [Streptomyces sp. ME18-1-4]MDX3542533.1 hypothetical protein [Streptomyces europaeiscabiei]